jgi:hypothetical protein
MAAVDDHQSYRPYGDSSQKLFVEMGREAFLCLYTCLLSP